MSIFRPDQEMLEHMHPVPIVCLVTKGSFLVSLGTQAVRKISVGEPPMEHAAEVVQYVRNLTSRPGQLYCAILAGTNDKQLGIMPDSSSRAPPSRCASRQPGNERG